MKKFTLALLLSTITTTSMAADNTCLGQKYDAYIDASLAWYQDLVELTTTQQPDLSEVGQWFLQGRQHHFELNRAAVHYFLQHQPSRVDTNQPIESWLKLEQKDIKQLAQQDGDLARYAQATFADRQAAPHRQNYELRSAFADLLSHPTKINASLDKYNQAVADAANLTCQ